MPEQKTIRQRIDEVNAIWNNENVNVDADDPEPSADTLVRLDLPDTEADAELSALEAVELLEALKDAVYDGSTYETTTMHICRIESANERSLHLLHTSKEWQPQIPFMPAEVADPSGIQLHIGLVRGFTAFALGIVREGYYDEYSPPFSEFDAFVVARFAVGVNRRFAGDAVGAYLYSLSEDCGVDFKRRPRVVDVSGEFPDENEEAAVAHLSAARRRHLRVGEGMGAVLSLYESAISHMDDPQYAFLNFAKVLEYVSATVVSISKNAAIRQKLLSPAALDPLVSYIAELIELVDSHRVYEKDAYALKLTVETCCDASEIAQTLPSSDRQLREFQKRPMETLKALSQLAAVISATRNQLSHAKASYKITGIEYDIEVLGSLLPCMRLVAQQVIRWFSDTNPSLRVV